MWRLLVPASEDKLAHTAQELCNAVAKQLMTWRAQLLHGMTVRRLPTKKDAELSVMCYQGRQGQRNPHHMDSPRQCSHSPWSYVAPGAALPPQWDRQPCGCSCR